MTPTREQLASIEWSAEWDGPDDLSEPMCPACRNLKREGHAPDCWLAACLAAPPPEPSIAARVRMAVERGCTYNVLVRGICARGTSGCEIDHAPEPQAMPPITVGGDRPDDEIGRIDVCDSCDGFLMFALFGGEMVKEPTPEGAHTLMATLGVIRRWPKACKCMAVRR